MTTFIFFTIAILFLTTSNPLRSHKMVSYASSTFASDRRSYGESCNATVKCEGRSFLTCNETKNVCDCLQPNSMVYDHSNKTCVTKSGEVCQYFRAKGGLGRRSDEMGSHDDHLYEITPCVQNGHCDWKGFCACDPNYFETSQGTCQLAQGWHEPCNSTLQCSRHEALTCVDNICDCDPTVSVVNSKMVMSQQQQQCVGQPGHPCVDQKCALHATCGQDNVCQCEPNYFHNHEEGRCQPKVSIYGHCHDDSFCATLKGSQLTCSPQKKICECNATVSAYGTAQQSSRNYYSTSAFEGFAGSSTESTECLGLVGQSCLNRRCVPRAYCSHESYSEVGVCRCQPGFNETVSGGRCAGPFGSTCDSPDSCQQGLVCKEGVCGCPYDNQEFDEERQICVGKLNSPCNATSFCQEKAECRYERGDAHDHGHGGLGHGHCVCRSGLVEGLEGECNVEFGGFCHPAVKCDTLAGLLCINGACQCHRFAVFDQRKCLGLVGAVCNFSESHHSDTSNMQCVQNAECVRGHLKQAVGHCACQSGFRETDAYGCEPEIEAEGTTRDIHFMSSTLPTTGQTGTEAGTTATIIEMTTEAGSMEPIMTTIPTIETTVTETMVTTTQFPMTTEMMDTTTQFPMTTEMMDTTLSTTVLTTTQGQQTTNTEAP